MKVFYKITVGVVVVLTIIPLFFPQYPEYSKKHETYNWGEMKVQTTSHIINGEKNTGYIRVGIQLFSKSFNNQECVFELLSFQARSGGKTFVDGEAWVEDKNKHLSKDGTTAPVLVSAISSRTASISDVHLIIEVKTNEHCELRNSIISIEERLDLKMRYHTLWNFLNDLVMSV